MTDETKRAEIRDALPATASHAPTSPAFDRAVQVIQTAALAVIAGGILWTAIELREVGAQASDLRYIGGNLEGIQTSMTEINATLKRMEEKQPKPRSPVEAWLAR